MELFKLLGKIVIDASGVDEAVSSVGKKMQSLGEGITKTGDNIYKAGKSWTKTVTAGLGGIGTAAYLGATSFEDAIAKVSTIADESEMSMEDMEKAILDLSNQTGVSATAIAEDVYNAISAGQKTADAVNFVSNSTKLAKAGFAETGQSLDVLTTIMNAYGMEAKDVTRVSDVLIQTQNLGKTTVGDLSTSMGKVIPTAKAYNVSLEQLTAAYTITTAKGIATAESTTYINSMLNELGKSGTTVSDTLKEKTGKSFSELMNEGYTLGDCLEIVDQAAKEQNLSFNDMWGSAEAAKAGVTLLGDSAEVFNGRLSEMNDVTGSTDTAFEKLETTSYKTKKAFNEVKNILIDLGGVMLEMVVPYLEKGAEKVHQFAEWFKNLDDGTKKLIITIGGIVAAVGPVLMVGGKVISGAGHIVTGVSGIIGIIGKLAPAIGSVVSFGGTVVGGIGSLVGKIGGALIPAIAAVPAPVWVVIAVLGALVAAGVAIYKNWDEIKEWGQKAWGAIKDIVGNAVSGIKNFFQGIIDFIGNNWQGLLLLLVNPFVGGFKLLYDNCESFRNFIDGFLGKIKDMFGNMVQKVSEKVHELKENIAGKFTEIKDGAIEKIKSMKENITSKVEEMKEKTSAKITEMKEKISKGFHEMKEKGAEKFSDLKEKWSSKFTETKEKMVSEAEEIKEKVGERIGQLKDSAVKTVDNFKDSAVESFKTFGSGAKSALEGVRDTGVAGFFLIKDKGLAAVENLKDSAISKFHEVGNNISEKFGSIADKITSVFSGARNMVSQIVSDIKGFFNFDWKLPDIKLPHFNIEWDDSGMLGSLASKIGLPGLPKLDVEWYAKGGIMEDPTAFGINPESGKLMVGGEAGPEAITPIETLKAYVREAVNESNSGVYEVLSAILTLLREYFPELSNMQLVMDTGALVGELAEPMNEELGKITYMRRRRN